jgi:hypothetical protein
MERKKSQNPDPPKEGESAARKSKGPENAKSECLVDDVQ